MSRRRPQPGDIYRHFKGRKYKILHNAVFTETGEEMVIFETVQGDKQVYASLLESFLSPLDTEKYSEAGQKYRFELFRDEGFDLIRQKYTGTTELILEFLDLEENDARAEFLQKHRDEIDSRFLTAASESLEFSETADNIEERFAALLRFLRTKAKYEGNNRLRK